MIEIKLNFNTMAEAIAFLAGSAAPASSSITAEKQDAARASTGKTTKPPAATPAPAPAEDAKPDLTALRTEVSEKVVKLASMDADSSRAIALMATFGAKRAKELKDDQLAAVLVAVDKALATADLS